MSGHRIVRYLALSASALVGLACGDYTQPTSPASAKLLSPTLAVGASFSFLANSAKVKAVRWGSSHSPVEQRVSEVIGPAGGTLSLPGSDFSMSVPSGALTEPVTITVVAKAGPYVAYEMLPHGLQFLLAQRGERRTLGGRVLALQALLAQRAAEGTPPQPDHPSSGKDRS